MKPASLRKCLRRQLSIQCLSRCAARRSGNRIAVNKYASVRNIKMRPSPSCTCRRVALACGEVAPVRRTLALLYEGVSGSAHNTIVARP